EKGEGLTRFGRMDESALCVDAGVIPVARLPVVVRPKGRSLRLAEHGAAPCEPAIMSIEPFLRCTKIIFSERECGCSTLYGNRRRITRGPWRGSDTVGEGCENHRPRSTYAPPRYPQPNPRREEIIDHHCPREARIGKRLVPGPHALGRFPS